MLDLGYLNLIKAFVGVFERKFKFLIICHCFTYVFGSLISLQLAGKFFEKPVHAMSLLSFFFPGILQQPLALQSFPVSK